MALVTLASQFSMDASQYSNGRLSLPTGTSFTFSDGVHTKVVYGSFTYDSSGNVSGTVTSLTYSINGELKYSMSGLDTPAAQMQAWCERRDGSASIMFAQVLAGDDTLNGSHGSDTMRGGAGDDLMRGNSGNDELFGGGGNDTMSGGLGKDTYYVDSTADRVYEASNAPGEIDRVFSLTSFRLPANVEDLYLLSTPAVDARGNGLNNALVGSEGVNVLRGYGGDDVLDGWYGNDTLAGGTGNDTLTGGRGQDAFRFSTPMNGAHNADLIKDFRSVDDRFQLDDATFAGLGGAPGGVIASGVFHVGAAAADADDRIIFDNQAGRLYYDFDGNGPGQAVLFAFFDFHPSVKATDFYVI